MRERFRRLRHVQWMKNDRLPKIVLIGQPFKPRRMTFRFGMEWKDAIRKDLREIETSYEGVKMEALNRLGLGPRRSVLAILDSGGLVIQSVVSSSSI